MKNNFIIATHNIHKIKEIETILNFSINTVRGIEKSYRNKPFLLNQQ